MIFSMLGEPYSFHHVAAMQYASPDIACHFHESFEAVINDLMAGNADRAIIAVVNSIAGDVPGNYERVVFSGAHILGEVYLHLNMHLAGKQVVPVNQLHTVLSHPMALKETAGFFSAYPYIRMLPAISTSSAARTVSEQSDPGVAVVANLAAIRFYNLQLIAKDIDKLSNNITRFLILSKEMTDTYATHGKVKASILLSSGTNYPDGPFENMTMMETGQVYLEFTADTTDQIHTRLRTVMSEAPGAKILGVYPEGIFASGN